MQKAERAYKMQENTTKKDKYDYSTILGKDIGVKLDPDKNGNVLVFGSSESGKTYNFVIPNILEKCGSYVVIDPRGYIYKETADYMRSNVKRPYNVLTLNLSNPKESNHYNPFKYINIREDSENITDYNIRTIAKILRANRTLPENDPHIHKDELFNNLEESLLYASLRYVHDELIESEQTLQSVIEILTLLSEKDDSFDPANALLKDCPENSLTAQAFKQCNNCGNKTYRAAVANDISLLKRILENTENITNDDNIDLHHFTDRPTILYIITGYSLKNKLAGILCTQMFNLIIDKAQEQGGKLRYPVRFFLDEFMNIDIPDIGRYMITSKHTNIFIYPIFQDPSLLFDKYGKVHGMDILQDMRSSCYTYLFTGLYPFSSKDNYSWYSNIVKRSLNLPMDKVTHLDKNQAAVFYAKNNPYNSKNFKMVLTDKITPEDVAPNYKDYTKKEAEKTEAAVEKAKKAEAEKVKNAEDSVDDVFMF